MNRFLKFLIFAFTVALGFCVTWLICTNKFEHKIVTYKLAVPTLPLKDTKKLNYITDKEVSISRDSVSHKLYVDEHNNLVIENENGKEITAKSVSNVKYIINDTTELYVLTNDGDVYYLSNVYFSDNVDNFKKINRTIFGNDYSNVFITNYVRATCEGMLQCDFFEDSTGSFYDVGTYSYGNESVVGLSDKYNNWDDTVKKNSIDVYAEVYDFWLYDNGKVVYVGSYNNGPYSERMNLVITDNDNKEVLSHVIFATSRNNIYLISLDNKLYNISFNTVTYDSKLTAQLVKDSVIDSISFDETDKKYTINFIDGTNFEVIRPAFYNSLRDALKKGSK